MAERTPLHILVVDDDPNHLKTLKTIIASWGYQVSLAEDGEKAVARVNVGPFDLILMDVRMAAMDGMAGDDTTFIEEIAALIEDAARVAKERP